ncbi:MAG: exonuclease domain-containing protein, partial [Anaerolineaceae bacterium]|nr:exonuclease domain-containing protein [Anaerolineaceae bacterium]
MNSLVALDIETTGLDPTTDTIIEIGVVRFNGKRVEAEWSSLINPNRKIPTAITQLTGITDDMVRNAPPLPAILTDISDFIGNTPLVGHNIQFDLSFLQPHNILSLNEVLDTYELAAVLLPTAGRYNLSALALELGIPRLDKSHRALADARTTAAVLTHLYEKAFTLPHALIEEFVRLSQPFDWGAAWVFQQLLRQPPRPGALAPAGSYDRSCISLFKPMRQVFGKPLAPVDEPQQLDPEEIAALMDYGGPFARNNPAYEQRSQQVEMVRQVTHALTQSKHLLIEAGTGIGKSIAYLLPAALWSTSNGMRVVISTNTINLQDQLINKDLPELCQALGMEIRVAVLKGRNN